jgi:NAD(P)-dependent dehydrogenase (short-subunit alcohol dehydrogenase family)
MLSPPSTQKVAVVTSSSSGIGFETSLALARNGFYTYATMRRLKEGARQITDITKKENLPLKDGKILGRGVTNP